EPPLDAEVRERVHAFLRDEIDATAPAAVASVGAALRDVLLTAKADRAVAAAAGLDAYISLVDELHDCPSLQDADAERPRAIRPSAARRRKSPDARGFSASSSRRSSVRHDADVQPILRSLRLEHDPAVLQREQRMVAPDADVRPRVIARAPLAHDDVPGQDLLAAEALHAEPFRFRIAAVLRAAACLFVCHRRMPSMFSDLLPGRPALPGLHRRKALLPSPRGYAASPPEMEVISTSV